MKTERKTATKSRVARILLNNPKGSLSKYRIAKLSNAGYPSVHRLLKQLEKKKLIEKTTVKDYRGLFEWWQSIQIRSEYRDYLIKDPLALLRNAKLEYGLTTYQAENHTQNYLFASRTDFYINPHDKLKWHKLLTSNGLVGKGNVRMLVGDEYVFYNSFKRNDLSFVSIPQIIVDLLIEGGVCVEAAEMLIEKVKNTAL
jgi:hypothetical protein